MNKSFKAIAAFWTRLSERERWIAGFCLLVVFGALFSEAVVQPYFAMVSQLQDELETNEIRLAKDRYDLAERPSSTTLPPESVVSAQSSNEEDMSRFLKEIESLGQSTSVRLVDLKPLTTQVKKTQKMLGIDIQLESTMPPLIRFLYALQTAPGLFEISRFQVTAGEGNTPLKVSLLLTKTLFVAKP